MFLRDFIKIPIGFTFSKLNSAKNLVRNGISVFVYHEVTDVPSQFSREFGLAVSTQTFRKQISWVKQNFNVIHPYDLLDESQLPASPALITFDDGMLSSFEPGLQILAEMNVPALFFLNMGSILEKKPLVSSIACFLANKSAGFVKFCELNGIRPPFHLTLNPRLKKAYTLQFGQVDYDEISAYQGEFAEMELVRRWGKSPLVVYGNHLYEHWNSVALSDSEFIDQFKMNQKLLAEFSNTCNLFAFPNGQPGTCFTSRHIQLLKELGVKRVFSSSGNINKDVRSFLLDRISFGPFDQNKYSIWFKVGLTYFKNKMRAYLRF